MTLLGIYLFVPTSRTGEVGVHSPSLTAPQCLPGRSTSHTVWHTVSA